MKESGYIISLESEELGYGKVKLHNPSSTCILPGVTVVAGENGSGKTTFGTILEKGRYGFNNKMKLSPENLRVKMISFTDIHTLSGMEVSYYHQRMEATMNDYVPTVAEIMNRRKAPDSWMELCSHFGISDAASKKINYLSSGELRKLLLVNALLQKPDVLVLDNPYIGLDAPARNEFDKAIITLKETGISVVMLLSDYQDIPCYTDHLITLSHQTLTAPVSSKVEIETIRKAKQEEISQNEKHFPKLLSHLLPRKDLPPLSHSITFEIRNGTVRYGDKKIFENLDWKILAGERWSLRGRNGSGKSLLLSLICADNPQAYSNDITLFDRRRGTGESIFKIKDNIGYVSPEMQLYFKSGDPVEEIIVQGLRNSLNRYHPSSTEEREEAQAWLRLLDIADLKDRKFNELSGGEQRLVLLARAFIKQPALLVLDEPFHGLDAKRKGRVKSIIDALSARRGCSLIFVSHYQDEIPETVEKEFLLGEEYAL